MKLLIIFLIAIVSPFFPNIPPLPNGILFKNATVIDGSGNEALKHTDILIRGNTIVAIGQSIKASAVEEIDMTDKTIMPTLISTHVHVGVLKGTTNKAENYTRENILSQLKRYEDYGVENIIALGSDRPMLFSSGLRDSTLSGQLPGARFHSAGYGFGVPSSAPPFELGMDHVFRPLSVTEIPAMMDTLTSLHVDLVKMWVDDFAGKFQKMDPAISTAVIYQAHKRGLRVASHVYYLSDARRLVENGLDIIAHSIRDSVVDDNFVKMLKQKRVTYIPTLSLDEFSYIYARKPEWINDPFFKAALEPGVLEMISSKKYQNDIKHSPLYNRNAKGFNIALQNLKKLHDAGVTISLGTDSGATPVRVQGFSEHLELELMVQAGLTPLQAITAATKNAAMLLRGNDHYGTLEKGKIADLLILNADPSANIKNTRNINAVYKAGVKVSSGPLNR